MHFKRPENFLRTFYQKPVGFAVEFGFLGKIYWTCGGNISAVVKNAFWAKVFRTWAKLLNRIVTNSFYVSRGTLWRKHCWLPEINSTFGRKIFGFALENFQDCCHMSTICFQMTNWKNVFAKNFTFLYFFGPPGNFFWFFRWIILGMVFKTAFFKPSGTHPLGKKFW